MENETKSQRTVKHVMRIYRRFETENAQHWSGRVQPFMHANILWKWPAYLRAALAAESAQR